MCKSILSLSIMLIRAFAEAVEATGVSREHWLVRAGFDPRRLDDSDGRVTVEEYGRLQTTALEVSEDEALGLHLGEAASFAAFDVIAHLTSHATTLRAAFEAYLRFRRILSDGADSVLEEKTDTATFRHEFPRTTSRGDRLSAEFSMAGFLRMIHYFVGKRCQARRVFFQHAAPSYCAEYTRVFAGAERFEQAFTGIEFDRSFLDRQQLHADPELYSLLERQAERKLGRVTRDAGYAERLREYLAARTLSERVDMSAVAKHFGISVRSLRRRLTEEGVSYNDLAEEALTALAKRMLGDQRRSIHETAHAMGFSDPAAFHRAFKRWTGLTPNEYRSAR